MLFDPILFHARLNPERPGLVALESIGRELSYGDIARRVEVATSALAQAGVVPRQRIGIHCRDRLLQIVTTLALSRIADTTLAFSPSGMFAPGSIDLLVTDDAQPNDAVKTIRIDPTALAAAQPSGPSATPSGGNSNWVFDAVAVGGDDFRTRIVRRAQAKGIGITARWLCAAGIHSELGLSAIIECLCAGGLAVLSNGRFEEDIQPIALYGADHLLVAADQATAYLRAFDKTSLLSASIRTAVIAGAPLPAAAERLKKHVSPETVVHLDLPETGAFAACSYWRTGKPHRYWPLPGIALRTDENGLVAIKSGSAVHADSDGWFRSSLAGSLTPDGALVLVSEPPS